MGPIQTINLGKIISGTEFRRIDGTVIRFRMYSVKCRIKHLNFTRNKKKFEMPGILLNTLCDMVLYGDLLVAIRYREILDDDPLVTGKVNC